MIEEQSVGTFLADLASSAPTPGGGSVAAIAAATGAAMVAMVARLTEGRPSFEAVSERMRDVAEHADEERAALLDLADRDAEAFDAVMASFKLPKVTDDEKAARLAAIQAAFAGAAEVPMEVARRASALLDEAAEIIATGNSDAASDGMSGAAMLHAGVLCALANVSINAGSLKDEALAERLRGQAAELSMSADQALDAARAAFAERTAS